MAIGKNTWVFADGDLPPHPSEVDHPEAHEALMVVNSTSEIAELNITLFFEDREPKENLKLHVDGKRVKCFRFDKPIWGDEYVIPFGQYALLIESSVPIVAVFGRLDRRKDMAYYPVAPYSA